MSLIGRGCNGTVYQLNAFIAVKRARTGEEEQADHANEQRVFQYLNTLPPIPYLIRCLYHRPLDTFLELAPNGCVAMLLNKYQEREGTRVARVTCHLTSPLIQQLMRQLCLAAAGLEQAGLIHGDIRPANMLLDFNWDLKLADLDRALKIGEELDVLTEPFGRLLNRTDSEGARGTYGRAGARTETFAIGSVYYTLLRGHEPYESESWGTEHFVILSDKLQLGEFPPLTDSTTDTIISKCWNGGYHSVAQLLAEFADTGEQVSSTSESHEWLDLRQSECKEYIASGVVDSLERY